MDNMRPVPAWQCGSSPVIVLYLDGRGVVFRHLNEPIEDVLCDDIVLTRIQWMRERRYLGKYQQTVKDRAQRMSAPLVGQTRRWQSQYRSWKLLNLMGLLARRIGESR